MLSTCQIISQIRSAPRLVFWCWQARIAYCGASRFCRRFAILWVTMSQSFGNCFSTSSTRLNAIRDCNSLANPLSKNFGRSLSKSSTKRSANSFTTSDSRVILRAQSYMKNGRRTCAILKRSPTAPSSPIFESNTYENNHQQINANTRRISDRNNQLSFNPSMIKKSLALGGEAKYSKKPQLALTWAN